MTAGTQISRRREFTRRRGTADCLKKSVRLSRSPRRPVRKAWGFPPERVKALPCFHASRKVDFQGSRPA